MSAQSVSHTQAARLRACIVVPAGAMTAAAAVFKPDLCAVNDYVKLIWLYSAVSS